MAAANTNKISSAFAARLGRLKPGQRIRALVLLRFEASPDALPGRRQTRAQRGSTLTAVRQSAGRVLEDVDRILRCHDGNRLAKEPNALGGLPVETTPAGIEELAKSDHVRAILEDQPIARLRA